MLDTRDPFYSSTTPQLYVIGCATVISYLLVIILLISPRTYFVGGPGSGGNSLGRHAMISGFQSGNSSIVGVGGRPWLQKIAALLVAVSLTIASVDSFEVAEKQYKYGYSDADALAREVIDGTELRVVRVISSTFVWLAQVQTLIRLFPRHKEKIMIKWAGFALIVLDTVFSCLDYFVVKDDSTHPRLYDDALPAISYLFELALNLLYAAWVIFYSLSKHRFAFYHPKMRSICLVALLSICSVLIPAVFFVLDIAEEGAAGWGTYVRWVGSAAASVVVWEWVERIEALEREETKDGVLGREIFDGDEMLEETPSTEVDWPRKPFGHGPGPGGGIGMSSGRGRAINFAHGPLRTRVGVRSGRRVQRAGPPQDQNDAVYGEPSLSTAMHAPVNSTPISRTDTTSASTVYNVRYHPVSSPSPVPMPQMEEEDESDEPKDTFPDSETRPVNSVGDNDLHQSTTPSAPIVHRDRRWRSLLNPFRRRRTSLPREVAFAQAEEEHHSDQDHNDNGLDSLDDDTSQTEQTAHSRINPLHSMNGIGSSGSGRQGPNTPLPVTVIPARRQGQQTWSPQWIDRSNSRSRESSQRPRRRQPPSSSTRRNNLPVSVIPSQPRTAAPWTLPDGADNSPNGGGDNGLHYDPETAALVGSDNWLFRARNRSATVPVRGSMTTDETSLVSEERSFSETLRDHDAERLSGAQRELSESETDSTRHTPGTGNRHHNNP